MLPSEKLGEKNFIAYITKYDSAILQMSDFKGRFCIVVVSTI